MTSTDIETERINPLDYVKPYFTKLTKNEQSILIGSILLFKSVKLKLLQDLLNLNKIELEEQIGRLVQSDFITGKFSVDSFTLISVNQAILQQHPSLTLDERILLAYLKTNSKLSIDELKNAYSLTFEGIVHVLSTFITRGLISVEKVDPVIFEFTVHYSLPKIPVENISNLDKQVIGYAILREETTFNEISDNLEMPEHRIQSIIVDMVLANMISCRFKLKKSKLKSAAVVIKIKHFQVLFKQRPLEMLSDIERLVIGYLNLRTSASLRELSKVLKNHRSRLLSVVSRLTATREHPFNLTEKGFLKPLKPLKVVRTIPIDQLVVSSLFNYRVLLGLISTEKKIDLKTIMKKMNVKKFEALRGIIDLYVSGQIDGKMKSSETFQLTKIVKTGSIHSIALESWERIILGALISEKVISWPKIAALLGFDRETAREKAYAFISRGIANAIARDTAIILSEVPKIPPLIQVTDLPIIDQRILGYTLLKEKISLKELRSRFNLTQIEAYCKLYLMIGSGLLVTETKRKNFALTERRQPTPSVPINEIEKILQNIVQVIEGSKFKNDVISVREISKKIGMSKSDFIDDLSILIARGYYDGLYDGKNFRKTKQLFRIKAKPQCFECNAFLSEINEPCPNCKAMLPFCTVCKGPLLTSDFIVACPYCKHESHSTHIKEWLNIRGECPICKNAINSSQLININF
ncbi:MAG: hypothetical protein HeimC2_23240 [Candidatus Heimdallarchaeota archaeon LC_2]|nr:MAG: hypothetical protein HeimC2_23240 [Candidatus Heimdallarchaeota archaeon LC_2]